MRLELGLAVCVMCLFFLSLTLGPANVPMGDSLRALFDDGFGPLSLVMQEIRLPRALLAIIVGAGLGLAGAAMQGYLRNPLAEPGLIGVSSSAALGAVLAGPRGGALTLILAGIAISALAGALTSLALNLSPNPFAANEIVFWMMGSLADRSMTHMWLALPFVLVGGGVIAMTARGLDALTLGEDAAETMGIDLSRLRGLIVLGTASIVGGITAVAGAIGFVGLVVPHILRPWVGAQPSRLMWSSALGGAIMVQLADMAVRLILPARDLKLGVVTALVGAPLFLHLIYKTRRELP
ncbi:iron ABC transporter permease [Shimia sp. R11_0]|uniref:FecCD family ABC transporter permease n=1 Tax=Shimia sp. R11_0 TaxID=2821096 RepID=UPI001ADA9906|nr:iron ABC transporter permease [Shimia sp. R11_0]MBO9479663.1 iron ABC transporter permease [Shimia sp. R11_0]